jgi:hypothetical protein
MRDAFSSILNSESQAAYVGPRSESEPSEPPWREANSAEITHSAYIASGKWEKCWKGQIGAALKEEGANAIFFLKIAVEDPIADHITARLCVLAPLLSPFGCDLRSSIQKQRQLTFPSYHTLQRRSSHPCTVPQVQAV